MRYPKVEVNFKVKHKMKIGELAARSGIPASTIRYYEREGLLPQTRRGANGYRVYEDSALERLDLIQLGQSLGFSLDAIRSVAELQGDALKAGLIDRLQARLLDIDRLQAVLDAQRQSLVATVGQLQSAWAQGACLRIRPAAG